MNHKSYRRLTTAKAKAKASPKKKTIHHRASWYSKASVAKRAKKAALKLKKHDLVLEHAAQKKAAARARSQAKRGASRQLAYARSLSRSQAAWRRKH